MPCSFSVQRVAGKKTDNQAIRQMIKDKPPLVMFGSYNERMYLAEAGARAIYIPVSFPGAIIRRHTGTPVMGYSGRHPWLHPGSLQTRCLTRCFRSLPLATDMDAVEATAGQEIGASCPGRREAQGKLDHAIGSWSGCSSGFSAAKNGCATASEQEARARGSSIVHLGK